MGMHVWLLIDVKANKAEDYVKGLYRTKAKARQARDNHGEPEWVIWLWEVDDEERQREGAL